MSKKQAQETSVLVKARVLVDGAFGKVNDIVEVDPEVAHGGELDTSPEAVAYAESLKAE
jgi:hypothetical protein